MERDAIRIRLGSLLSGPGLVLTDEMVSVTRISPPDARNVIYEELPPGTNPEVAAIMSEENLVGTLATTGARMAVFDRRDPGIQGLMPMVYDTVPDGVVKISVDTNLELRSNEAE